LANLTRSKREDVARLAGVSVATVSYVLNNSPKPVAEKTRQRVMDAVRQLNYKPHAIARSLKTGNSMTIGLVVPALASRGMAFMASRIQYELARHNYQVVIVNSYDNLDTEQNIIDMLISQSVDGLIATPASAFEKERFSAVIELGIPLVFVDREVFGMNIDIITSDNVSAGRDAAQYLIDQGCRRIICITFSPVASSALQRVDGYRQALAENGLKEDVILTQDSTIDIMEQIYLEHAARFEQADGVICTMHEQGVDFLRMLKRRGVPLNTYKTLLFDAEWAELLDSPIPAVLQDLGSLAVKSVEKMMERLSGSTGEPEVILYKAKLIPSA
jgi:LacI family transcriptional regulator